MDKNKLFDILKKIKVTKKSINFISAHSILFKLPIDFRNKIKKRLKMEKNTEEEIKHKLKMCFLCVIFLCYIALSIIVLSYKLPNRNWAIKEKWIDTFLEFVKTKRFSEIETILSFDDIIAANLFIISTFKK